MPLFPCYDCRKEISLSATHCPNCGSTKPFSDDELKNAFQENREKIIKNIPNKNLIQEGLDNYRGAVFSSVGLFFLMYIYILFYLLIESFLQIKFSENTENILLSIFTILQSGCMVAAIFSSLYENYTLPVYFCFDFDKYISSISKKRDLLVSSQIENIEKLILFLDKIWLKGECFLLKFNTIEAYKEACQPEFNMTKRTIFFIFLYTNTIRTFFYSSLFITISLCILLVLYIISNFSYIGDSLSSFHYFFLFEKYGPLSPIIIYAIFAGFFFGLDINRPAIIYILTQKPSLCWMESKINTKLRYHIKDFSSLYRRLLDINKKITS